MSPNAAPLKIAPIRMTGSPPSTMPAGYMIGGEVVHGDELISTTCPMCGEFVCDNCSDDDGLCFGMCSEQEPDEDWYD